VDRFSVFPQCLALSGWVLAEGSGISALEIRPRTGAPTRFKPTWLSSPDVAQHHGQAHAHHTPGPSCCRYEATVVTVGNTADACGGELWCVLDDRACVKVASLGDPPNTPTNAVIEKFFASVRAMSAPKTLEVGSRARSGLTRRVFLPADAVYIGCDIKTGPNVDLVCDAHRLSSALQPGYFDAVMAFSVLEHLLMPWKFVIELNKVLKEGAIGLFTTHQCWPMHDEPWDFWRFSDRAWTALLNPATGFEILEAKMGEPAFIVAKDCHNVTNFAPTPGGFLASNVMFRKVSSTSLEWPVDPSSMTSDPYPI
jgi:hypothetical protein